jgi:SAM-dependent methyltransferase
MSTLFDSPEMALGYARSRPPMHKPILDLVRRQLNLDQPVDEALDVGCGAGLSTAPLAGLARHRTGVEPFASMLRYADAVAPGADFAAGQAEALPVRSGSIDLCTAAGSLPFTDVPMAMPELRRVLRQGGTLVVYDFRQGSDFPDNDRLTVWHSEFKRRYPPPPGRAFEVRELPLPDHRFELAAYEPFEIGLTLTPDFYLDYSLTETNVAAAIGRGVPEHEVRKWCEESLAGVFRGERRQIMFKGYIAYLM